MGCRVFQRVARAISIAPMQLIRKYYNRDGDI